jgi:predicted RNase H-like HicB family nuclease
MQRYLIVLEPTQTGYSAYSPDLPGCVATGASQAEVEANMREAIVLHLQELRDDGEPVPSAQSIATYVEVAA